MFLHKKKSLYNREIIKIIRCLSLSHTRDLQAGEINDIGDMRDEKKIDDDRDEYGRESEGETSESDKESSSDGRVLVWRAVVVPGMI